MVRDQPGRSRAKAKHVYFTDEEIARHKPKRKQYLIWDAWAGGRQRGVDPARGLCVLISPKGSKSFRVCYYFKGSPKPHYIHLGRVGEMTLAQARERCRQVRNLASEGKDPAADNPTKSDSFEMAFNDFIQHEQIGARQNKSAMKTKSFVLNACDAWRERPVATIRYSEIEALLWEIRDGNANKGLKARRPSAIRIFSHLQDFFGWCAREGGPIKTSPMAAMKPPADPELRDRFYTDDEVKDIWDAANRLENPAWRDYVKLIFLTALRREELARARWSEMDDPEAPKLFTVPFVRTKGKITRKNKDPYLVPLVPLAQRLLKGLRKSGGNGEMVFPRINADNLMTILRKTGAPTDFELHVARHTITTWLQNQGHSDWERNIVLNQVPSGVVSIYSHGYPLELKRELLTKWAAHVEGIIQPEEGVALLR